jgi:hypothetical protein
MSCVRDQKAPMNSEALPLCLATIALEDKHAIHRYDYRHTQTPNRHF